MTTTAHRTTTVVIDNPAYAWRAGVLPAVKDAFYAALDADFVHDYRAQLDAAATELFGPVLVAEWARRGFQVVFGPDDEPTMIRRPKHLPHCQVWDTACNPDRLDPYAVVHKAGLDDELVRYAAAHPRVEHLEAALDGLRPHHTVLRADLHHRLDRWVGSFTDATSDTAWHQADGWRNAIETAATRAQLDHLAAQIPA